MSARRIPSAVILILVMWCTSERIHGQSTSPHAYAPFSAMEVSRERRYQVDARVRPFLFWVRKSNIGDGRLTWRRGPDGAVGYELLVGSDPARTPRKINRWGYLREELGGNGAIAFGVMSQSDEESVADADKNTSRTDDTHAFKALQQLLTASHARVTISDVRVQRDLTYADLGALLSAVPAAPSQTKTVTMPECTSPGFLAAAASLMEEGRTAAAKTSNAPHFVRTYPYNGQLYELRLQSAEHVNQHTREGRSFGPAIRGRFSVLNRTTGDETPFLVVYGAEGELTGVPLLISWRPRWWFQIECALRND